MRILSLSLLLIGLLTSLFGLLALNLGWASEFTGNMHVFGKQCEITLWHPIILFSLALALFGVLLFLRSSKNDENKAYKSFSYHLFGLGAIPSKLLTELKMEGIEIQDEGIRGQLISRKVNAPGRFSRHRREGFSGWLVLTQQRLVAYSYGKRQINILLNDEKMKYLHVDNSQRNRLSLSFESANFHKDWQGVMEFQFHTPKAEDFHQRLLKSGARPGKL